MTREISFDAETGLCRLPRVILDALVDLARGVELPASLREPLTDSGVLEDGGIHPALAEPLAAAAEPDCRLVLFLAEHDSSPCRGTGAATAGAGLIALDTLDDRVDVLPVPPGFFAPSLARVFGLGPRPRLAFRPVLAPHKLVEDVLSERPRKRAKATAYIADSSPDPATQQFARLLAEGPWTWKSVRVEWPASDGTVASRALHVWDSLEGMAIFENRGDTVAIDPLEASTLFLLFTKILPRPSELLDLSTARP